MNSVKSEARFEEVFACDWDQMAANNYQFGKHSSGQTRSRLPLSISIADGLTQPRKNLTTAFMDGVSWLVSDSYWRSLQTENALECRYTLNAADGDMV